MDKEALIGLARQKAEKYGLDGDLVCAVVEQESDWRPHAIRFEPAFLSKYVSPLYTAGKIGATEAYARSFSWGLLQIMGQVAREEGFEGAFLSELCDPETGLDSGCKHLAKIFERVGDVQDAQRIALLHWNGGSNTSYPDAVKARIPTYNA